MPCRILSTSWRDEVSNSAILERAALLSKFILLRNGKLRWLGYVCGMEDDCIPKDLFFRGLELGFRPIGRFKLRFRDVCKRDMLAIGHGLPPKN